MQIGRSTKSRSPSPPQLRESRASDQQWAPYAAGCAVRVEPRDRGGHCHPPRARGDRARLRRNPGSLDDYVEQLPAKAAILVCSSYNGLPPDNAIKFHHWMNEAGQDAFDELSYTVFGCGNTEWATTYQAVPTQLDAGLEQHGANRIHPRGAGDARGDFDAAYRNWHDTSGKTSQPPSASMHCTRRMRVSRGCRSPVTNRQVTNPVIMSYHAQAAVVRDNHELLGANAGRSTRHVEVALLLWWPTRQATTLECCRATTSTSSVVSCCTGPDAGSYLTIIPNRGNHTHLPTDEPAPCSASWAVVSSFRIRQPAATSR